MSTEEKPANHQSPPDSFQGVLGTDTLINKINQIKENFQAARAASVTARLEANQKNLESHSEIRELQASVNENGSAGGMLSARMQNPPIKINGLGQVSGEGDCVPVMLPYVEKIPHYTTWTFSAKNQMMPEEESVIGKKMIYYQDGGSETLFCSDSEEDEGADSEEQRHEFTEEEVHILWMTYMEYGIDGDVLDTLRQFVGGSISEIQERCNLLRKQNLGQETEENKADEWGRFLGKRLSDALDSFDTLFCRRCLVFDCNLHGCSQGFTNSSEKLPYSPDSDDEETPCGDHCYLLEEGSSSVKKRSSPNNDKPACKNKRNNLERQIVHCLVARSSTKNPWSSLPDSVIASNQCSLSNGGSGDTIALNEEAGILEIPKVCQMSDSGVKSDWKPLEKDLLSKGIDMFGRRSCLIARNLLPGLRTCKEVFSYLNGEGRATTISAGSNPDDNGRINNECMLSEMMAARARVGRKKGRGGKLKFSTKSTGHPSNFRRNIGDKNSHPLYTPCGCQSGMCGQDCPCLLHGTCCEKYCGCSRSCRNRYRGCHCAKGQCQSRQCPCFASGRECDPDVCHICWISCGTGDLSLGEPPIQGEVQCGNMQLLLKQHKRIILGRSEVSGWGAFTKEALKKGDYLGEYTGEVMTHREADKRGKVYDRANSSYLFNLNDEYALDAYRKGDKLKFANHSSKPNCHAKVMFVGGDHRVGIYASQNIDAGQELFYDYQYSPGCAPPWAQKPDTSTSTSTDKNKSPPAAPQGRAKKHPQY